MKFRAVVKESMTMKEFINIIIAVSKQSKECVMRITEDYLYFIIPDLEKLSRKPFIWCQLEQTHYFREYFVSGFDDDHKEIFLEFNPIMLAKSISIPKATIKSFKLCLTQKQTSCLTIGIETAQGNSLQNRKYIHDIPVDLISDDLWSDYLEPTYDENHFDVTFMVPSLKNLRNISDRMKNIDNTLHISVTKDSKLALQVRTPAVKILAHFPDSTVKFLEDISFNSTILDKFETSIDIKKFVQISNWCNYLENYKVTFHLKANELIKMDLEQTAALCIHCILIRAET